MQIRKLVRLDHKCISRSCARYDLIPSLDSACETHVNHTGSLLHISPPHCIHKILTLSVFFVSSHQLEDTVPPAPVTVNINVYGRVGTLNVETYSGNVVGGVAWSTSNGSTTKSGISHASELNFYGRDHFDIATRPGIETNPMRALMKGQGGVLAKRLRGGATSGDPKRARFDDDGKIMCPVCTMGPFANQGALTVHRKGAKCRRTAERGGDEPVKGPPRRGAPERNRYSYAFKARVLQAYLDREKAYVFPLLFGGNICSCVYEHWKCM